MYKLHYHEYIDHAEDEITQRDHFILCDDQFSARFYVNYTDNDLIYLSRVYYEISHLYKKFNYDYTKNILLLFQSEYIYSLEKRGIDIRHTRFFKNCGIDVNKLVILL